MSNNPYVAPKWAVLAKPEIPRAEDVILPHAHFHESVMAATAVGDSSLRFIIRAIASPITTVVK